MRPGVFGLLSLLTVACGVLSPLEVALAEPVPAISAQELSAQAATREDRVEEFRAIRQEAERMGLRVWLFGGTAAGYLHYVKWDLQREKGDNRFQDDRFDYDFTNIYRSTQDLDIVADGPAETIAAFSRMLASHYPHFLGSKARWEVRSLREASGTPGVPGYKEALLNDFDFLNQDTDSNSTGMIEITRHEKDSVVRDLRDWNNEANNRFLSDSANDRDTFYRSPTHGRTARAKAGQNPEIFSVIRALTKAFQYELSFSPQDWQSMQEIINRFSPTEISDAQTHRRLLEIGKKLFKHAVNLEYAWNTLEKLGLREKLTGFDRAEVVDSLAWWMNKEPLRTHAVGAGHGKTAKELGLDVVAHETSDFLAYESITRAHTGDPNVFISREKSAGESAAHGKGFYTRIGRLGARQTGMTIRFHLDPQAREGSDFSVVGSLDYILIHNKAALKVIQESLGMSPVEYFRYLDREDQSQSETEQGNRGIIEKMMRKFNRGALTLAAQDEKEILKMLDERLHEENSDSEFHWYSIYDAWFRLQASHRHPEIIEELLDRDWRIIDEYLVEYVFSQEEWARHPKYLDRILNRHQADEAIARYVLTEPYGYKPQYVSSIIGHGSDDALKALIQDVLSQPQWVNHPEFIEALLHVPELDSLIAQNIFTKPYWPINPTWVRAVIQRKLAFSELSSAFRDERWVHHPEFIQAMIDHGAPTETVVGILNQPFWADQHPELLIALIRRGQGLEIIQRKVLPRPYWKNNEALIAFAGTEKKENIRSKMRSLFKRWDDPAERNAVTMDSLLKAIQSGKTMPKAAVTAVRCEALYQ